MKLSSLVAGILPLVAQTGLTHPAKGGNRWTRIWGAEQAKGMAAQVEPKCVCEGFFGGG